MTRKSRQPAGGRISKPQYYLNIAKEVARRSTCLRRHYGAVIVNNDQIVSTGYAGAPRRTVNCTEVGSCVRIKLGVPKGEHYEWCRAVHAEQNAVIHAARFDMIGATLYLAGVSPETGEVIEGAATVDAHVDLPTIRLPRPAFERTHLAPFRAAVAAGVDAVMTSHVRFPAYDSVPATFSSKIVRDVLQGNLAPALLGDATPEMVAQETRAILEAMRGRKGHIFNLGHGVPPNAKLENIAALVETVKNFK